MTAVAGESVVRHARPCTGAATSKAVTVAPAGPLGFADPLVRRASAGNRDAQCELLRSLQDVWFRFAISRLGRSDEAREATQETAARFLQGLSRARGGSVLRTWSLGIVLNVCREMQRKCGERSETGEVTEPADRREPPETLAIAAEESVRLREVMALLPPRQREAVILRYFEELSIEETARVMGCAQGTVKATLAAAIASIRGRWETRP